jgi:hypothetical protein
VSTELGAKEVNQLNVILDKDSLTLFTSVIPTSLTCTKNCPMCSYVVLMSSPVNFAKSRALKPHG